MSTTQAMPEQAPAQVVDKAKEIMDSIIENTDARRQAESARSDKMTASIYSNDANAYAIAMGRDLGLNAALSLQLIHIIGGKPALSAGARSMFLAQAGYSWRPVVHTDKQCTLRFYFRGDGMTDVEGKPLDVTITFEEAERAQWVQNARGSGKIGNWDKFPKNMLFARVISNFHRWYAPHVVGAQVYDAGELMDNVIEATVQTKSAERMDALEAQLAAKPEVAVV